MSADLMPFNYGDTPFRTLLIDGDPCFIANDVSTVLDIRNGRDALARLDDDEKGVVTTDTLGGPQQMAYVTEAGLYSLILTSRKPEARAFKRWITHDVLPTIRRTGAYGQPVERLTPLEYARSLVAAEERAEIAQARATELEAKVEADRPMVERAKTHATAAGEKTRQQFFREVKQWAHDNLSIEVKQAQVVEFLSTRKLGIFIRGNRSDSGQATATAIERGYAVNREDTALNGHNYVTGKLTARGQEYAWERIFRYIDANGTLELPRQIGAAS